MKRNGDKYFNQLKKLLGHPPNFHFDEKAWKDLKRRLDNLDQSVRQSINPKTWIIIILIVLILILFGTAHLYQKTSQIQEKLDNHILQVDKSFKQLQEEKIIIVHDTIGLGN